MNELQARSGEIEALRQQFLNDGAGELEEMVDNLKLQLEEQERDSSEAVAQWEATYKTLEERCNELESRLSDAQAQPSVSSGALMNQIDSLSAQKVLAATPGKRVECRASIENWEEIRNDLESRLGSAECENDVLSCNWRNQAIGALRTKMRCYPQI